VQVVAVHVPPSLDRKQMVRMTGRNNVKISETDRWSAPLDEMIRNVLAQDLVARLPKNRVILPDAPAPPGTGMIVVTIAQYGPDPSGDVKLNGSWTLLETGSNKPILERNFQLSGGTAASADATAAATSRVLAQLARVMSSVLSDTSLPSPNETAPSEASPTPSASSTPATGQ
jgi:uncharacterized lipoprotein YmbA